MIKRDLSSTLKKAAEQLPAVAILGPRQSGKTTIAKTTFPDHSYINLEDPQAREFAELDPKGLLEEHPSTSGIIIDEIQHAPQLLSYMQTIIDRDNKKGFFIITGSQNILVNQAVTQTLAGRIAMLTLFPLSINELLNAKMIDSTIETAVFKGSYPRLYNDKLSPTMLYTNYVRSYIERDVRQLKNILNLKLFQKFMGLCAGRIGQILNLNSLCNDCGIDTKTARSWISLLEATYVIFLLQPYYKNFGKRLIKSPKLYFVDSGIACALLNIKTAEELKTHYLKGGLIESFIIADLFKQFANMDSAPTLSFWRDSTGNEIDCLVEHKTLISSIEIKSSQTINTSYFKQFGYIESIKGFPNAQNFVIYSGEDRQRWPAATVVGWKEAGGIIKEILN